MVTALLVAVGRIAGAVQAAEVEEVAEAEEAAERAVQLHAQTK